MAAEGPALWDGWGSELPPLLFESATSDYLIGHPSLPEGFVSAGDLTVNGSQVYARPGHLAASVGVQPIGDQLGVVLLPLPELQALVDKVVGKEAIQLDDAQYVRWAAHEAFHIYELQAMDGDPPRFGFDGDEMEMIASLTSNAGFGAQLAQDGLALARALEADSDQALREAVARFLQTRTARRAALGPDVAGFEQAVEWTEGLARYTDVRLMQAAGEGYQPDADFVTIGGRYPSAQVTWADAIQWLRDLSSVPGTLRDQYYELGAAQAYLLDRLMPGWQGRALPGGSSLESLLRDALTVAAAGIPTQLRTLSQAEVQVGEATYRVAVADNAQAWGRGLEGISDLGPLDGLLFAFPVPVRAEFFMKGAVVPLDIAFFDTDGVCLQVTRMPLCSSDPCPTFGAPGPYRWALEAQAGRLSKVSQGSVLQIRCTVNSTAGES
jgi:uncharacterized membrane protein (UPF0127 family)